MSEPAPSRQLVPALIYAALCTAVVSSLGMLLVPSIAEAFRVPVSTAQWMLTVNLLVGAVATPVMGRLSDGPNKKGLLVWALAIIVVGSVLAALAPNFAVFLVGRALQGLTYGIVPVTIALARRYVPVARARTTISTLSVTVASGLGVGYPLTGVIAGISNFRLAFWFGAVFALTALVVTVRVVPAGPDRQAGRVPFDFAGAALLGLGLGSLLLAISEGPTWGWGSTTTIGAFAAAVVILGIWVATALRKKHPLINLRVFAKVEVVLANVTAICLGSAIYIGLSISSLVAQAPTSTSYGLGLPVFWAGFVMFPLSVGSFTANRLTRRLAKRMNLATLLPVGAALVLVSSVMLWRVHSELWEILLGMLLFGLGIGASYAAMPALIARSVATEELGSSVSFNQVLRTVGSSFGTAASGAVLAVHTGPDLQATEAGIAGTFGLGAAICATVFCALIAYKLIARSRTS